MRRNPTRTYKRRLSFESGWRHWGFRTSGEYRGEENARAVYDRSDKKFAQGQSCYLSKQDQGIAGSICMLGWDTGNPGHAAHFQGHVTQHTYKHDTDTQKTCGGRYAKESVMACQGALGAQQPRCNLTHGEVKLWVSTGPQIWTLEVRLGALKVAEKNRHLCRAF